MVNGPIWPSLDRPDRPQARRVSADAAQSPLRPYVGRTRFTSSAANVATLALTASADKGDGLVIFVAASGTSAMSATDNFGSEYRTWTTTFVSTGNIYMLWCPYTRGTNPAITIKSGTSRQLIVACAQIVGANPGWFLDAVNGVVATGNNPVKPFLRSTAPRGLFLIGGVQGGVDKDTGLAGYTTQNFCFKNILTLDFSYSNAPQPAYTLGPSLTPNGSFNIAALAVAIRSADAAVYSRMPPAPMLPPGTPGRPTQPRIIADAVYAGPTSSTGDASIAQSDESVIGTAALAVQGAATISQAAETISAAGGTPSATGDSSITQAAETVFAAGTLPVVGTASEAQAAETSAAAGTLPIVGAATKTQSAQTILATASDGDAGVLLLTQAPQSLIAAAAVSVQGAASLTQTAESLTAQGGQPFVPPVQDNSGGGYFPQQTDRSRRKPQPQKPVEKPQPRVVQVTRVGRLSVRQEDGGVSAAGTVATGGDSVTKQAAHGMESKAVVLIGGFSWTDTPQQKSDARGAVEIKGGFRGHQYSEAKAAGVVDWRDVIAEEDQLLTPEMWKSYVVTRALKDFQ